MNKLFRGSWTTRPTACRSFTQQYIITQIWLEPSFQVFYLWLLVWGLLSSYFVYKILLAEILVWVIAGMYSQRFSIFPFIHNYSKKFEYRVPPNTVSPRIPCPPEYRVPPNTVPPFFPQFLCKYCNKKTILGPRIPCHSPTPNTVPFSFPPRGTLFGVILYCLFVADEKQ